MNKDEKKLLVLVWRPVDTKVEALRKQLGSMALFFYNDICPEVVTVYCGGHSLHLAHFVQW
jgi:hypothetical protein